MANCMQRELEAVAHVTLLINRREHVFHRLLSESKLERDLAVLPAGDDAAKHVAFTRAQLEVRCHWLFAAACEPPPLATALSNLRPRGPGTYEMAKMQANRA